MNVPRILIVGTHAALLAERERALRDAGFDVTVCKAGHQAKSLAATGEYAAVVTGHALDSVERMAVASAASRRGAKIIMLHMGRLQQTELADAVINAVNTSDLVAALESLLAQGDGLAMHAE